jgi:hypothetical protein
MTSAIEIIDLSANVLTEEEYKKISSLRKRSLEICGHISKITDVEILYNLPSNDMNQWYILYDKILFHLSIVFQDEVKHIQVKCAFTNKNKLWKILKIKEIQSGII